MQSWWLNGRASAALLDRVAAKIQYRQERNAQARLSHTKRTRRKLRRKGIKLTEIERCRWGPT